MSDPDDLADALRNNEEFQTAMQDAIDAVREADQRPPNWSIASWGSGYWCVIDNEPVFGPEDALVAAEFETREQAEAYVADAMAMWRRDRAN
jgi:hypothetical protein